MLGLPGNRILKKKKDFQAVYSRGKSYANRFLVLYVFRSNGFQGRVGFAAGKKLGNAVKRNRVKRLLRESYRLHQDDLQAGVSLLLVGRKAAVDAGCRDLEKALLALSRKAGILVEEKGFPTGERTGERRQKR